MIGGTFAQKDSEKLAELASFVHVKVVHLGVDGVAKRASARHHAAHVGVREAPELTCLHATFVHLLKQADITDS